MLKIRLTKLGKRHDPHYRIIVTEARSKRDGKAIEYLGRYDPRTKELVLDEERAKHWLSVGAKPTETVHSMLAKKKLLKPLQRAKREPKKPKKEKKMEKGSQKAAIPQKQVKAKEKDQKTNEPGNKEKETNKEGSEAKNEKNKGKSVQKTAEKKDVEKE